MSWQKPNNNYPGSDSFRAVNISNTGVLFKDEAYFQEYIDETTFLRLQADPVDSTAHNELHFALRGNHKPAETHFAPSATLTTCISSVSTAGSWNLPADLPNGLGQSSNLSRQKSQARLNDVQLQIHAILKNTSKIVNRLLISHGSKDTHVGANPGSFPDKVNSTSEGNNARISEASVRTPISRHSNKRVRLDVDENQPTVYEQSSEFRSDVAVLKHAGLLACPYAKYDRHQYKACKSLILRDIGAVKQHLRRIHEAKKSTGRNPIFERAQNGVKPEDTWNEIFEFLFGPETCRWTPYQDFEEEDPRELLLEVFTWVRNTYNVKLLFNINQRLGAAPLKESTRLALSIALRNVLAAHVPVTTLTPSILLQNPGASSQFPSNGGLPTPSSTVPSFYSGQLETPFRTTISPTQRHSQPLRPSESWASRPPRPVSDTPIINQHASGRMLEMPQSMMPPHKVLRSQHATNPCPPVSYFGRKSIRSRARPHPQP